MPRSSRPSPFGKRTDDVRTKVARDTKLALIAKWHALGYATEADYLADVIEIAVHGFDRVSTIALDRLKKIAGIGHE
jgi:adenine-specific DNA glycosylase